MELTQGAVSYLGNKLGNHSMDRGDFPLKSTPWNSKAPVSNNVPLGNQVALNVGKGGPGVGRVVHSCGTQGQQGPTNKGTGGGSPFLDSGANKPIGPKP
jgi:hypothetical protein